MTFREASSDEQKPPEQIETPVLVNPATSALLQELSGIRMLLQEIRSNAERNEVPAPSAFHFFPQAWLSHVRLRTTNIVICPAAATSFGIKVGTNIAYRVAGATGAIALATEITIERGTTVELIDLTTGLPIPDDLSQALDAYILGYPE